MERRRLGRRRRVRRSLRKIESHKSLAGGISGRISVGVTSFITAFLMTTNYYIARLDSAHFR
jgi:hypothetical protein